MRPWTIRCGGLLLVACLGTPAAGALAPAPGAFTYHAKEAQSRYQTPEDVFDAVPLVSMLPRKFLFTGGYSVKLSITEMRIDHMAIRSRCPMPKRNCTLSVSYAQPIGTDLFSGRFDFPLMSATSVQSHWGRASFGDYVVHLSNTPMVSNSFKLLANAKF